MKNILKKRKPDTHKGDYGHVFVLAGSVGMTGAAYLCSQAALLSGAGLVTLGIPQALNNIMEIKLTEVMTKPLPQTEDCTIGLKAQDEILKFEKKINAFAIGPGLSKNFQTQALIRNLIVQIRKAIVLDADGINAVTKQHLSVFKKSKAPLILTPHPGELSRLLEVKVSEIKKNREEITCDFAKKYGLILVLKGHNTIVADKYRKIYKNKTGNPGMATAGCGDILTGMIAGFLAQGADPFEAAKTAVYLHGLAGDLAAKEKGQISLIATDVLNRLPEVIKRYANYK